MPRHRLPIPKYSLHKRSGKARVRWTDANGKEHSCDLGVYGSPESREAYERFLAEWRATDAAQQLASRCASGPSVAEVMNRFDLWAATYYRRDDGSATNEVKEIAVVVDVVVELYGSTPAGTFGPLALKAVRQVMIEKGWCRTLINRRVERLKRGFKWAASEELIPATVYEGLKTVEGLKRGRCAARESKPVRPVPSEHVEAIQKHVLPEVWSMILVQFASAMRPQDVCALRPCDVDRSGAVWLYRPPQHKRAHASKVRVVPIGPRGQAILKPMLEGLEPDDHVFSPARAVAAYRARLRAARKTKVQPSQLSRLKPNPKRWPGMKYTAAKYAQVIARACKKAGVPTWGPNRLRHTAATEIRGEFGLEAAQHVLGHEKADVTQIYAERNLQLASEVILKIG